MRPHEACFHLGMYDNAVKRAARLDITLQTVLGDPTAFQDIMDQLAMEIKRVEANHRNVLKSLGEENPGC